MIGRREFFTCSAARRQLGRARRAQQDGGMRRIGALTAFVESDPQAQTYIAAFREGAPETRVDGGSQLPDGCALGGARCGIDEDFAKGICRAAARPYSFANYTQHCGASLVLPAPAGQVPVLAARQRVACRSAPGRCGSLIAIVVAR